MDRHYQMDGNSSTFTGCMAVNDAALSAQKHLSGGKWARSGHTHIKT